MKTYYILCLINCQSSFTVFALQKMISQRSQGIDLKTQRSKEKKRKEESLSGLHLI